MNPIVSVQRGQSADSTEGGQVMINSLRIPLILRKICQCFSTKDLIRLSLVNKQWNYEARSMMKKRANLTASINITQTCQNLKAFAKDLRRMKEGNKMVPFSGMTISLGCLSSKPNHSCQQLSDRELLTLLQEILSGLTWKHLSVRMFLHLKDLEYCVGLLLVKKVLGSLASVLQEFSMDIDPKSAEYLMRGCLEHCSFPRLQTFKVVNEREDDGSTISEYTYLIKTVVSRAPNLQAFHSTGRVDLHGNLLEGSSAVHVAAGFPYPICWIPESLIANQLRFAEFYLFMFSGLSLERFNSITSKLLQSSVPIMSTMGVEVVFLVPLMLYGICLENVRRFTINIDVPNVQKRQPDMWKAVKSFDFTRVFPKLNTVLIMCYQNCTSGIPDEFNEMIEQGNALTPSPDRAANIKHLRLQYFLAGALRRRASFRLLAEMFPHIEKLTIEGNGLPLAHIGDIWVDLKQVDVTVYYSKGELVDFDSAFCGIFPQEVDHLLEQDEDFLRKVHVVPVMPSIIYLKELRTFTACLDSNFVPRRMFSKVSALIGFQRYPNLTVKLRAGDERVEQAMSHLRPYATVFLKDNPRA